MGRQFFTITHPWHQHLAQNEYLTGVRSGTQASRWRRTAEGLAEPLPSVMGRVKAWEQALLCLGPGDPHPWHAVAVGQGG